MAENGFGDFFISDVDDELVEEDELISVPVVVPGAPASSGASVAGETGAAPTPAAPASAPAAPAETAAARPVRPAAAGRQSSREERLAAALDALMEDNQEIEAAALVSLDGFTMASALPDGMHEDRVGAMSAAILGLGERAAAELGRGHLSQVFIEGEGGYVVLIAAGDRAVLTCLADMDAKLGLVLYDMRDAAEAIAGILG